MALPEVVAEVVDGTHHGEIARLHLLVDVQFDAGHHGPCIIGVALGHFQRVEVALDGGFEACVVAHGSLDGTTRRLPDDEQQRRANRSNSPRWPSGAGQRSAA